MEKVIKVKEIVPPKDYHQLKVSIANLQKENDVLKKLVSEGNFNDLENMVTSCKVYLGTKCKAIAFEFNTCKYSKKNKQHSPTSLDCVTGYDLFPVSAFRTYTFLIIQRHTT